jgi:hypothetical protein
MPSDIFLDTKPLSNPPFVAQISDTHMILALWTAVTLFLPMNLGIVERVSCHSLTRSPGDKLDGLNDAIDDLVLDTRVFALSVLSNEDGVDVVVGRLVTLDGHARSNVCKEIEGTSEGQVEDTWPLPTVKWTWVLVWVPHATVSRHTGRCQRT